MNQNGMTLRELVLVILVIAAMTIAAIPAFFGLRNYTRDRDFKQMITFIQSGIQAWHERLLQTTNAKAYPPVLDNNPVMAPCKSCFESVLPKGISSEFWFKASQTEYYFSRNGNFGDIKNYQDRRDYKILYKNDEGLIEAIRID